MVKIQKQARYLPLLVMALPGFIYLVINNFIPMAGLTIAFKQLDATKGLYGGEFIGLQNFRFLFATADALNITRNTIFYNLAFIVLLNMLGVALAILFKEIRSKFFFRFYQTIILLPHMISMVIVSYLAIAFLDTENGWINSHLLQPFGMPSVSWYSAPGAWPYILTFIQVWKNIGFFSLIYFSSVVGIDEEYYESARLDGANTWNQILHITLPSLTPVVTMMVIVGLGQVFRSDFGLFYQVPLDSGILYDTTNVLDTYIYRTYMKLGDVGMSSAAGLYQSVIGFITLITANFILNKVSRGENGLF